MIGPEQIGAVRDERSFVTKTREDIAVPFVGGRCRSRTSGCRLPSAQLPQGSIASDAVMDRAQHPFQPAPGRDRGAAERGGDVADRHALDVVKRESNPMAAFSRSRFVETRDGLVLRSGGLRRGTRQKKPRPRTMPQLRRATRAVAPTMNCRRSDRGWRRRRDERRTGGPHPPRCRSAPAGPTSAGAGARGRRERSTTDGQRPDPARAVRPPIASSHGRAPSEGFVGPGEQSRRPGASRRPPRTARSERRERLRVGRGRGVRRRAGGQQRVLEGAPPLAQQSHRLGDRRDGLTREIACKLDGRDVLPRLCPRRRSRDATVPRGRPNVSAISLMLISSSSNSVNTARNDSGRLPRMSSKSCLICLRPARNSGVAISSMRSGWVPSRTSRRRAIVRRACDARFWATSIRKLRSAPT